MTLDSKSPGQNDHPLAVFVYLEVPGRGMLRMKHQGNTLPSDVPENLTGIFLCMPESSKGGYVG